MDSAVPFCKEIAEYNFIPQYYIDTPQDMLFMSIFIVCKQEALFPGHARLYTSQLISSSHCMYCSSTTCMHACKLYVLSKIQWTLPLLHWKTLMILHVHNEAQCHGSYLDAWYCRVRLTEIELDVVRSS